MPRKKSGKNFTKFSLTLDDKAKENIEKLQGKMNTPNMSETVRAALALSLEMMDYVDKDKMLFTVVDPNDPQVHVKFKLIT